MRYQSLAFVAPFLFLQQAYALSNITFYSDDQCTDVLDQKTGPDDGTCTPFPTLMKSYGSFRVSSLDQTCSVTLYGSDTPYCSSKTNLYVGPFGDCLTDDTVNQFSVDCQDYSVAISSPPNVYAGATTEDKSSKELSAGAKAGIGIAAAAFVLILVGLIIFFVIRNNRAKRRNAPGGGGVAEADSNAVAAPPYSELPPDSEKKIPVELPPQQTMIPVEAPGDHAWPIRELDGSSVQSKIKASALAASNVEPLSKRHSNSDITPLTTSVNGESTMASSTFSPVSPEGTK